MSSPRRPTSVRGRLPASVYWRRRVFVLGLAASLVFVIASWLTGGSDGKSSETPVAEQAAAQVEPTETVTAGSTTASEETPAKGRKKRTASPTPTLAAPEGPCDPADVVVTPEVDKSAVAGRDVTITLSLQSIESEACDWEVAPDTVTVKIARGDKPVWLTRHCQKVVPTESVVVRRAVATVVELTWNARESGEGCRRATEWVLPGDYSIAAAALGGEPVVAPFSLASPTPETIRVTPKGKTTPKGKATATPKGKATKKAR